MDARLALRAVLTESAIDPTREDLDPDVFIEEDGDFQMRPEHRRQLDQIIQEIDQSITPVHDWYVKGSILSMQWLPWTDVDVLLEIDEDIDDEQWYEIFELIRTTWDGATLKNTDHPIEIFPNRGAYNPDRADGIYHVPTDKWIKGPYDFAVDVDDYLPGFLGAAREFDVSMGQLSRDIADFLIYRSLSDHEAAALADQIQGKLMEIDADVGHLVDLGKSIKQARQDAFSGELTPDEIARYGSSNKMPANIIQKLLERYNYMALYSALRDIRSLTGDEDRIDSPEEIEMLRKRLGVTVGEE